MVEGDAERDGARMPLLGNSLRIFIRIGTNHRLFNQPLTTTTALAHVQSWLNQPNVRVVVPSGQHWQIFRGLIQEGQAAGNLVSDANLAALAIEHGCVLHTTDADFSRFSKLKWKNPLKS